MLRQLRQARGVRIVGSEQFSFALGPEYARSQLEYAARRAEGLSDARLRDAFLDAAAAMRAEVARPVIGPRTGPFVGFGGAGRSYAIVAKRER